MRGKLVFLSVAVALVVLAGASVASAITHGQPDAGEHPYVGVIAFYSSPEPSMDGFLWRCSGTLLSPNVLLTAGHCTYGTTSAWVWFESPVKDDPFDPARGYQGTPITNPAYRDSWGDFPNTHDVGVVVLDPGFSTTEVTTYGTLPQIGVLDQLATKRGRQDMLVAKVGYGYLSVVPKLVPFPVERYKATSMVVNLRSALTDGFNLHTSSNPGKGQGTGGDCYGDSGGPVFYPHDSNVVVGIISFGLSKNCVGADFAYRTDIGETQDFLETYLP